MVMQDYLGGAFNSQCKVHNVQIAPFLFVHLQKLT